MGSWGNRGSRGSRGNRWRRYQGWRDGECGRSNGHRDFELAWIGPKAGSKAGIEESGKRHGAVVAVDGSSLGMLCCCFVHSTMMERLREGMYYQ